MEQKNAFQKAPGLEDLARRMQLGLRLSRQRLQSNEPFAAVASIPPSCAPPSMFKQLLLFPWFFLKRRFEALIRERIAPLEQQLALQHEKILDLEFRLEFQESNAAIQHPGMDSRQSSWKHLSH